MEMEARSPLHRENMENVLKYLPSLEGGGKTQAFGSCAKTQGILFAQVVNSLRLKIQDIVIFAAKFSNYLKSVFLMKL